MYKLFNDIDDTYINQETMENIIRDVAKDVVSKISGTLYNKMKLIYNGDEINNIIVKKVQLLVTDYSTNINSIVESNIKTNIDLSSAFEE